MSDETNDRVPWDRFRELDEEGSLKEETDSAFRAFQCYRDIPLKYPEFRRSIRLAYVIYSGFDPVEHREHVRVLNLKQAPGYFAQWSTDYQWVKRASAFDDHLDAQRRDRNIRRTLEAEDLAFDAVGEAIRTLVATALGEKVERQHGRIGDTTRMSGKEQMTALDRLLAIAGLATKKELKVDQSTQLSGAVGLEHSGEVDTGPGLLSEKEALEVASIMKDLGVLGE